MKKDLISIMELEADEIFEILVTARNMKLGKYDNDKPLKGKVIGLIFQKPSTRTRVSFEVGIYQLGGFPIFLRDNDLQLKRGETIEDTARVLSRYLDGMVLRAYAHDDLVELARHSSIPVINGLTDRLHPCQVISDIFTIAEKKGIKLTGPDIRAFSGIKIVYIGDGNNIANSWMNMTAKLGMKLTVCSPRGYEPDMKVLKQCLEYSRKTGARIKISGVPAEAVKGADVIYTDVWKSMGDNRRIDKKVFSAYQVNSKLIKKTGREVLVMHCLPAHRGEEITDEVMDGKFSVVFDQAENRLHVQKAIMKLFI